MDEKKEKIVIAADHAGFETKEHVKEYLRRHGFEVEDLSAPTLDPADDYPVFGFKVARSIASGRYSQGILMCGTGIGISIAANRYKGVRAALCTSPEMATMARQHNDANVLVVGGRTTGMEMVDEILDAWFRSSFGRERHARRVAMLDNLPDQE